MSSLKNHHGFFTHTHTHTPQLPAMKGLLDGANNGINLTTNRKKNRFYYLESKLPYLRNWFIHIDPFF